VLQLFYADAGWSIHFESVRTGVAAFDAGILELVESTLVSLAVANSWQRVWLHGACLSRGDGCDRQTLVLIGPSGVGKTTLSLALLHLGYRLLTDDVVLISVDDESLLPFPRSPKFRVGCPALLRGIGCDLEAMAGLLGRYIILRNDLVQPVPVPLCGRFVFLTRGHARTRHAEISLADALRRALRHSNLLRLDPTLTLASRLFRESRFFELSINDFHDSVGALLQLAETAA
jgi:hypothetical protein